MINNINNISLKSGDDNNFILYKKIAIVLVLMFILKFGFWFEELLGNFGLPDLRYKKLWLFYTPGLYILSVAIKNNYFKLINIYPFLSFYIFHYLMEHYAYGPSYNPGEDIDLLYRWYYIYISFLFLSNTGIRYYDFILKSSITIIILNLLIIYTGFFNIFNIADISLGSGVMIGRWYSNQNLNIVNDMNVLAVFMIYFLYKDGVSFKFFNLKIPYFFYFIFLLPPIFLHGSRGSLLLLTFGVVIYYYLNWKKTNITNKILMFISVFILILIQGQLNPLLQEINVFERLQSTSVNLDTEKFGRTHQIYASFGNFKSNPIYGVGYKNAANNLFYGIERSNFQYTQILGTGGIVLFFIYFFMVYRFFGRNIKLIKGDIIVFSILGFVLIEFLFRRPEFYFSILAFVVYFKNSIRSKI